MALADALRECLICATSYPLVTYLPNHNPALPLPCGHHHCFDCITRNLVITLRTMPFRPVQCCERIPTDLIRRVASLSPVLTPADLLLYRQRLSEHDAPRKIYCWDPKCSTFIPPAMVQGHSAKCRKCSSKTCTSCLSKFHFGPCAARVRNLRIPAPVPGVTQDAAARHRRDVDTARKRREEEAVSQRRKEIKRQREEEMFKRLSSGLGWKACPRCKRMVEKTEGCNHITCLCGCEWCYRCGKAPWWNHGGGTCAM